MCGLCILEGGHPHNLRRRCRSLCRLLCGLPLPIIAGLLARWLPIRWTIEDSPALKDAALRDGKTPP
jgi:hypothetical protein